MFLVETLTVAGDFVVAFFGQVSYLTAHRGLTHSVLMLPLWAWLLAWTFAKLARDAGDDGGADAGPVSDR